MLDSTVADNIDNLTYLPKGEKTPANYTKKIATVVRVIAVLSSSSPVGRGIDSLSGKM